MKNIKLSGAYNLKLWAHRHSLGLSQKRRFWDPLQRVLPASGVGPRLHLRALSGCFRVDGLRSHFERRGLIDPGGQKEGGGSFQLHPQFLFLL